MTLPNFLVIGAPKAATTSLDIYLREHPDVFVSPKGSGYFASEDPDTAESAASYASLFADATTERAIGEVSASYLGSPNAAERIRSLLPHARLIASLRNPVDRAYSGYLMQIRKGNEDRSIENAFHPDDIYVEGGFYYKRLRRYYDRFDPAQIKICLFDEFKDDPGAVLRSIFEFLEVDPSFEPDLTKQYNVGGYPRSRWLSRTLHHPILTEMLRPLAPKGLRQFARRMRARNLAKADPMPRELRDRLLELYRSDIDQVQDLIGRDLSHWLEAAPVTAT